GDTRSYGRQSQAGNSITWTSGPKKANERDKVAIRCPSRQITASEMAGAFLSAAIARARSASTSPSAPSATLAKVKGWPARSNVAGDLAMLLTRAPHRENRADAGREACRTRLASIPFH